VGATEITSLVGRHALVTGAASGIGLETARLLRAQGAAMVLPDRCLDALEKATAEFGQMCG
jgi:NADP-dependent 3-hydroxy acid dehydrogenase YdfG